jgi:hypothetical protein
MNRQNLFFVPADSLTLRIWEGVVATAWRLDCLDWYIFRSPSTWPGEIVRKCSKRVLSSMERPRFGPRFFRPDFGARKSEISPDVKM